MATEDKLNDYDFTGTDAGASHTIPSEAGQIRKGGYIVIKGHPCKVSSDNGLSLKSVPTLLAVRTEHFGVTWYAKAQRLAGARRSLDSKITACSLRE